MALPRWQNSWGQQGAHLGTVGPRWAPWILLSGLALQKITLLPLKDDKIEIIMTEIILTWGWDGIFDNHNLLQQYWEWHNANNFTKIIVNLSYHAIYFFISDTEFGHSSIAEHMLTITAHDTPLVLPSFYIYPHFVVPIANKISV